MRSPTVTRMLLVLTLMATGLTAGPAPAQQIPPIVVSPEVPSDIPGGAPNANLAAAATFAWQEFIALNWPARAGMREAPDTSQPFGRNGTGAPSADEAGDDDGGEEREEGEAEELAGQKKVCEQREGNGGQSQKVAGGTIFAQWRGAFVKCARPVDQHR